MTATLIVIFCIISLVFIVTSSLQAVTPQPISYYDKNILVQEKNSHHATLSFLYTSPLGKIIRPLLATQWAARCAGWYYDSSLSKRAIQPFIDAYSIPMDDYLIPPKGFTSFNDFFTRKLKADTRLQSSSPLTCPTDGKVFVIPELSATSSFYIKDIPFNLETFLGNKQRARDYEGGTLCIIRLAPYDYHRFHFPINCIPSSPQQITGSYESVNPLVYKQGIMPLTTNERQVINLSTNEYSDVKMIVIGAMFVGTITTTYIPDIGQSKGSEAGYFSFGGSSIVLLFKKNKVTLRKDIIEHSQQGYETALYMGESLLD